MATKAQREYLDKVYNDAIAIGIPEVQARLAASQSAIETGYGKHAPGNAYFGMKAGSSWNGKTQNLNTKEEVNGALVSINDTFRAYDSPQDSLLDWWDRLQVRWPDAANATSFDDAVAGLKPGQKGGYATDSNYGSKLNYANNRLAPRPPGYIPEVASQLSTRPPTSLAGSASRPAAPQVRSKPAEVYRTVKDPLPFPGMLKAPPRTLVASTDNTMVPGVGGTIRPPAVNLNPPMPPRPSNSWPAGTSQTGAGPSLAGLTGLRSGTAAAPTMAETRAEQMLARAPVPSMALPAGVGALAGGTAGYVPPPSAITPAPPIPAQRQIRAQPSARVSSYQQQLASNGFNPGSIDGLDGPKTQAAVKAFQTANGLVADGIVGPKTLAALGGNSSVAKPTVSAPKVITPPAAPAPSGGGNIFGNLWNGASTGIGNAFNTVKEASAPAMSAVGNTLKDEAIKAAIGTKAGRTALIDGTIGSIMRGSSQDGKPVTRYNPSTGKWTTTGPAVKTQLSVTPPMVTRASSTPAAKPSGFGSKGYSAEGLALKNMFRR